MRPRTPPVQITEDQEIRQVEDERKKWERKINRSDRERERD